MSIAVLDRVEAAQRQSKADRRATWLGLVAAFLDGNLPDAAEIARIFDQTGKSRADLERDAALLREYRDEQAQLAQVPELREQVDALGAQLSDAIKARTEAEQVLRSAQDAVVAADNAGSTASRQLRHATNAAVRMRDPKFSAIADVSPTSLEAARLTLEIAQIEARLAELARLIAGKRQSQVQHETEMDATTAGELSREEKQEKLARLTLILQAAQRSINSLCDEQYTRTRDLAGKRRELKELSHVRT